MITFNHFNFNVLNLDKSLAFYKEALGLVPVREKEASDESFKLVYLGDGKTDFTLELTWLRDRTEAYNLGECEFHLAFTWMTLMISTSIMKRWDASAMRTLAWVFISSRIQTATGLRLSRPEDRGRHNGRIGHAAFGVWDFTVLYSSSAAHHLHPCLLDDIQ